MRTRCLGRYVLSISAAALLGGCGNSHFGTLTYVGGTLYGTTLEGGAYDQASGGGGTVFSLTASGKETVLHSFGNGKDGAFPYAASMVEIHGMLYGTTGGGGAYGLGTVFSISKSGNEKVLFSFQGGTDGAYPFAGLIDINEVLYGTTHEAFFTQDGSEVRVTVRGENYASVLDGAMYAEKTRVTVPNVPAMTGFSPDGSTDMCVRRSRGKRWSIAVATHTIVAFLKQP